MEERTIRCAVITGPTGAIGTALCRKLTEKGIKVYAIVRPDSKRKNVLSEIPNLTMVYCGLNELERLPELIREADDAAKAAADAAGNAAQTAESLQAESPQAERPLADCFFHLAWGGTTGAARNDMELQLSNVEGTIRAARAAKALGCSVFVGVGSQAEYGRVEGKLTPETPPFPENGYGIAKLCAGQMSRVEARNLGMAHVWTRVLSVYGPGDGPGSVISLTIRKLLNGEKPSLTAGEQQWDYLYSDDAAEALCCCAMHGRDGAVYVLGGGSARPLREYLEILRDKINPELELGLGDIPYPPLQVMHLEADITPLKEDTGFAPVVPFEEGIENTIQWVKEHESRG